MPNSSPLRRSQLLSSPDRGHVSSFLLDDRNTELSHRDALAAAQAEHDRVRELALRVFDLHKLKEKHNQIVQQERREQERLRAEAAVAAEEKRLQELKAKSIPKPPPPPPPPKPEPEAVVKSSEKPAGNLAPAPSEQLKAQQPGASLSGPTSQQQQLRLQLQQQQQPNGLLANGNPFGSLGQQQAQPRPPAASSQNDPSLSTPSVFSEKPISAPSPQPVQQKPSSLDPLSDRYIQIHQALKKLRSDIISASKVPGSPLKGKVGSLRREIRISIGQLTGVKGANTQIVSVDHPRDLQHNCT